MAHTIVGVVTSDARDKTITVADARRETHPLYRKQYTKTRKYTAHDEKNEAHVGDRVEIVAVRPISKTKSYKLVRVIERSHGTVELKEGVTEVEHEAKVGADAEYAEARKAEKKGVSDAADVSDGVVADGVKSEGEEA